MKVIKYESDMAEKLLSGVEKTVSIVSKTMGPVASNVIITNKFGAPRITKDGITVIDAVQFEDKIENTAASLIREASAKTNAEAGDGTTGTAVLLGSIYKNGLKYTAVGGNKIQIRNGISKAAKKAIELVEKQAVKITDKDQIRNVALIASNHSDEIADVLADVFDKIGTRGVIKVEEGNATETVSNIVEGCQYDTGWMSPYFSTNDKMEADLDSPFTVFCDKKLSNFQELLPLLQSASNAGKPLFIMCQDMDGEAFTTLIVNRLRGLQVCVVKAPSYGENQKAILQDLAALTGSVVVSDDTGIRMEDAVVGSPVVGQAKHIFVTKDATTILGGEKGVIAERIKSLDKQIESEKDDYAREKLEERRAKLEGGVAIISVGGSTKSEITEKKDLVDDAFNAVKAALKNGVVAGGGKAMLNVYAEMADWRKTGLVKLEDDNDEAVGVDIFVKSLQAPIKTILQNGDGPVENVISLLTDAADQPMLVYDVLGQGYCQDAFKAGIIDPASVIIAEIKNASSIAGLLLTSAASIVDIPEKNEQQGMNMPQMM